MRDQRSASTFIIHTYIIDEILRRRTRHTTRTAKHVCCVQTRLGHDNRVVWFAAALSFSVQYALCVPAARDCSDTHRRLHLHTCSGLADRENKLARSNATIERSTVNTIPLNTTQGGSQNTLPPSCFAGDWYVCAATTIRELQRAYGRASPKNSSGLFAKRKQK